jgi:glc operon protein GlcG
LRATSINFICWKLRSSCIHILPHQFFHHVISPFRKDFMNNLSHLLSSVVFASVLAAASFSILPLQATAQSVFPAYGAAVSLDSARKLIAAARIEASKNKWNMAITVVDTSGAIVAMERMDDSLLASAEIAVDKARSANGFKRSTKVLQDAVTSGFTPILGLIGATPVEGGLPIVVNGKIIGAIGVSGATPSEDGQVATASLSALK